MTRSCGTLPSAFSLLGRSNLVATGPRRGAAIDQAHDAAGGKDVLIAGGLSIAQQALAEGLVDDLSMHIAPVLIGSGARLIDNLGPDHIRLTRLDTLAGNGAMHVRYRVER